VLAAVLSRRAASGRDETLPSGSSISLRAVLAVAALVAVAALRQVKRLFEPICCSSARFGAARAT
jgi:hypothetical protein